MEESMNAFGKITWSCPRCLRVEKGLCWECGKAKEGERRLYCAPCAKKRTKQAIKRHNASDAYKERSSNYAKKRWKKDPEFKERKTRLKKEWMEKNPHKKQEYKLLRIYKEMEKT